MQPVRYTGLALGLLFLATSITAQAKLDKRFYIAPMASYTLFNDDMSSGSRVTTAAGGGAPVATPFSGRVSPEDSIGYTLAIGKPLGNNFNIEIYGFRSDSVKNKAGSGGKIDIEGYGLTALFFPLRNGTNEREILPSIFGILGFAGGDYDASSSDPVLGSRGGDAQYIDVGLGFLHKFFRYGIGLRMEYRYRAADVEVRGGQDLDLGNHVFNVGLQIPLGAPPEQPKPEPAPVRAAPPPPPPAAPKDSDGDGVLDPDDECPGTPPNTEVDAKGCPVEKAAPIVLKGVTFEFNSAQLTAEATKRLDNVVNALKGSDKINVSISGYTDNKGADSYNLDLSDKRAASVRQYLIDHGIDSDRLTSKGYGETMPVAPNTKPNGSDNPQGRAKNRRVELDVTN